MARSRRPASDQADLAPPAPPLALDRIRRRDEEVANDRAPKRSGARNLCMLRLEPQLPQTMPARAGGEECS